MPCFELLQGSRRAEHISSLTPLVILPFPHHYAKQDVPHLSPLWPQLEEKPIINPQDALVLKWREKSPSMWPGADPQVIKDIFPWNTQMAMSQRHRAALMCSGLRECTALLTPGIQRQTSWSSNLHIFLFCWYKNRAGNLAHVYL